MITHHKTCSPDYPEKDPREAPRAVTVTEIGDETFMLQCCDCGAGTSVDDDLNFFTFGQSHAHAVDGLTFDKDSVVLIIGDYGAARAKMVELFGQKWGFQYDFENFKPHYFPRGILKAYRA